MIDIAIPCYEYGGVGHEVLGFSFERIATQTFRDFRVVISDHSTDDKIKDLCDKWSDKFEIKYLRNERGRGIVACNLNNLLDNCDGEYIKWMDQDDYFLCDNSLEVINLHLKSETPWLATAYIHTQDKENYYNPHFPTINQWLCVVNTIGTMSCTVFKNFPDMPRFDENLRYSHDELFYWQFMEKFGLPKLINLFSIANYIWPNSTTSNIATSELIKKENNYILRRLGLL